MNFTKVVQVNKSRKPEENLEDLDKEVLISRIRTLEAHNNQLKNILAKSLNPKQKSVVKKRKPFEFENYSIRHILLNFLYLGWDHQGFVVQEDTSDTIEHHLFEALEKTCLIESRETSNYHRCGRTDKGVSSFGQVISITVRSRLDEKNQNDFDNELNYCKILNRVLPETIQCISWKPVPREFSARFDCKSRTYKYFFPLGNLNIDKMREGAKLLIGTHDFRNFCKMDVGNGVTEFVRNVEHIEILHVTPKELINEYGMNVFVVKSGGFLWHQIRSILGVLILIGQQKESPEVIRELLDVKKNPCKPDYGMASEIPLNLYSSEYDLEENSIYDNESLGIVIEKLRKFWTFYAIKSNMIKSMIDDLLNLKRKIDLKCLSEYLVQGAKMKNHVPLMERPKCDSLEKKIEHYIKKKKLINNCKLVNETS